MTPSGINPATLRFVAQYLNNCATVVPGYRIYQRIYFALLFQMKRPLSSVFFPIYCPTIKFLLAVTEIYLELMSMSFNNPKIKYKTPCTSNVLWLSLQCSLHTEPYKVFDLNTIRLFLLVSSAVSKGLIENYLK
jgi:hypothetical protein